MRIIAINGSPQGAKGNTDVLVQALLSSAAEAGADTETVYLAEKRIEHCRGCHSCWNTTPGRCVITDDMAVVLGRMAGRPAEHGSGCCAPQGAGLIVLASPVYLANVSGTLKDFIDRLTVTGNPHAAPPATGPGSSTDGAPGATGPGLSAPPAPPRFVMVSTCGYPGSGQFDVISLWVNRLAAMMGTTVAAEIYATQGRMLRAPAEGRPPSVDACLAAVRAAGAALARGQELSARELSALRGGAAVA